MKRMPGILALSLTALTLAACEDVTRPTAPNSPRLPNAQVEQDPEYTECNGTLAGGPYNKVVVPEGGFCFLVNAIVLTNVVALQDAVLAVFDTRIGETIFGFGADVLNTGRISVGGHVEWVGGTLHPIFTEVALCGATVAGNVIIERTTGTIRVEPDFCGAPNTIKGEVRLRNNVIPEGETFSLGANTITVGPVRVLANRGLGAKSVVGNVIGGSLVCENNQAPFVGGPNVAPRKRGQCF